MEIYLTEEERRLLTQLVESRVRELHPTIRRSRVYECTDGLKHDMEVMQGLLERLEHLEPISPSDKSPE